VFSEKAISHTTAYLKYKGNFVFLISIEKKPLSPLNSMLFLPSGFIHSNLNTMYFEIKKANYTPKDLLLVLSLNQRC